MCCKLCLKDKELCDSHIIPNFFFRSLKSKDKSSPHFDKLYFLQEGKKPIIRQTGVFEKLLCADCENKLGEYDSYASKILKYDKNLMIDNYNDAGVVKNVEYQKFKIFQMSIIWRAGISNRPEFKNVKLGPKHSEKLREMILYGNPGETHEYCCILFFTTSKDININEIAYNLLIAPEPIRVMALNAYRSLFGMLWWLFIVDKMSYSIDQKLILSKKGDLPLFKDDKYSSELIREEFLDLAPLIKSLFKEFSKS